ncbi:MAG: hypothetical protein PHV79_00200 [Clostridia bacterium]|jgi:hypothetical protein|nr:hypothetical protein [Clostridia bacterium]
MENSNINIYLRNTDEEGTPADPTTPGSTPNAESPEKQKENNGNGGFGAKALAIYLGKQAFQMASARVGQYTRNSVLQDRVSSALRVGAYVGAIAVNPVLGAAAYGIDLVSSSIDYNFKSRQEGSTLAIKNERAGNINRSR